MVGGREERREVGFGEGDWLVWDCLVECLTLLVNVVLCSQMMNEKETAVTWVTEGF